MESKSTVLFVLAFTWCTQLMIAFNSTMSFCSSSSDALHSKLASFDRFFSYVHKPRKNRADNGTPEGRERHMSNLHNRYVPWGVCIPHLVYSDVSSCIAVAILCQKTFHRPRGTGDQTFVAHTSCYRRNVTIVAMQQRQQKK